MQKTNKGFTLVEVIVVVAIIALVAAIAIPNLLRARTQANEAAAQGTLKAISNAMENYASINNVYPTNTTMILGATPPYLSVDYFNGVYYGYVFSGNLSLYTYSITALPITTTQNLRSFTVDTSGVVSPK